MHNETKQEGVAAFAKLWTEKIPVKREEKKQ